MAINIQLQSIGQKRISGSSTLLSLLIVPSKSSFKSTLMQQMSAPTGLNGSPNRFVQVNDWSRAPFVRAYQALRGVSLIVAATMVAEIGDMSRFKHPNELIGYLGLVPSEHSGGEMIRRGPITKTGNSHARRVLVEAAWTYKMVPKRSQLLIKRQQGLPKSICDISWKAQLRLCNRHWRLLMRGKKKQTVITAIARELSAFIWAIDREVQLQAV
jgi:hypothetical protein